MYLLQSVLHSFFSNTAGFTLYWARAMGPQLFGELPEELQGACVLALDTPSAGCFSQVNKACKELVEGRLAADQQAARDHAVLDKVSSRWCEALFATCRAADGPNLISFSDGGA